jgi:hypothetical protein
LPLRDETNYVAAALVEPWACVTAAYRAHDTKIAKAVIDGSKSKGEIEDAFSRVAANTTVEITNSQSPITPVKIDIGRIHYDGIALVGTQLFFDRDLNTRNDLKPGGKALFIGAGGPMGQMHVQRALTHQNPPSLVVITDINKDRLLEVQSRFAKTALRRGIVFHSFLTDPMSPDINHGELAKRGEFHDIVSLVPSAEIVPFGLAHLAENGVFNVFAGVAKGSFALIDIGRLVAKNQRIIGTTGSTIADMRRTLELVESGALDTNLSLAAVGGLDSLPDGLDAVKSGALSGKIVIFPNSENLPLTSLGDLEKTHPDAYSKLDNGYWTPSAESALLESMRGGS